MMMAAALATACSVWAVEFDSGSGTDYTELPNGLSVVAIDGVQYVISPLPEQAVKLQIVPTLDELQGFKPDNISPGEEMNEAEVQAVLKTRFERTAFDAAAIRIRDLTVGNRAYAAWCANYLFVCMDWQARAGTYATYEVNGRNRSGGMTGFQRQTILIRKVRLPQ